MRANEEREKRTSVYSVEKQVRDNESALRKPAMHEYTIINNKMRRKGSLGTRSEHALLHKRSSAASAPPRRRAAADGLVPASKARSTGAATQEYVRRHANISHARSAQLTRGAPRNAPADCHAVLRLEHQRHGQCTVGIARAWAMARRRCVAAWFLSQHQAP